MKIALGLAVVGLIVMVYALIQGNLWSADVLAFSAGSIFMSYRTEKRLERRL